MGYDVANVSTNDFFSSIQSLESFTKSLDDKLTLFKSSIREFDTQNSQSNSTDEEHISKIFKEGEAIINESLEELLDKLGNAMRSGSEMLKNQDLKLSKLEIDSNYMTSSLRLIDDNAEYRKSRMNLCNRMSLPTSCGAICIPYQGKITESDKRSRDEFYFKHDTPTSFGRSPEPSRNSLSTVGEDSEHKSLTSISKSDSVYKITLTKRPFGLGMHAQTLFITKVGEGEALRQGVKIGDQLISINGNRHVSREALQAPLPLTLEFRCYPANTNSQSTTI